MKLLATYSERLTAPVPPCIEGITWLECLAMSHASRGRLCTWYVSIDQPLGQHVDTVEAHPVSAESMAIAAIFDSHRIIDAEPCKRTVHEPIDTTHILTIWIPNE